MVVGLGSFGYSDIHSHFYLSGICAITGRRPPINSSTFGAAQLTIETIVAFLSTVIRAALRIGVTGALSRILLNRFSPSKGGVSRPARPPNDLDTFRSAATDLRGSLKLLWRTKGL